MSANTPPNDVPAYHRQGVTLDVVSGQLDYKGSVTAVHGEYRVEVNLLKHQCDQFECVILWRGQRAGHFKMKYTKQKDMLARAVDFINSNEHATTALAERRDAMLDCPHRSCVEIWSDGYYIDQFARHARNVVTFAGFTLGWVTMVGLSPAVLPLLALNCLAAGLRPPHNMTPRHGFHHQLPYFLWNVAGFPGSVPYYVIRKLAPALHKCNETGDFAKDMGFRFSDWGTLRRRCERW